MATRFRCWALATAASRSADPAARARRQVRQGGAGEARHLWPGCRAGSHPRENVRAALALVARGEAPLGIVYATDAAAEAARYASARRLPPARIRRSSIRSRPAARRKRPRRAAVPRAPVVAAGAGGLREARLHAAKLTGADAGRDRDRSSSASRSRPGGVLASLPLALALAWLLARARVSGQDAARRPGQPASGAAAGRRRLRRCWLHSAATARSARSSTSTSASCSRSAGPAPRSPAALMGLPLVVRAMRQSLEAVDRRLEDGGRDAGRRPRLGRLPR